MVDEHLGQSKRLTADAALSPEPISPELVLVCPELAAAARAALPNRPWEVAVSHSRPVLGPPGLRSTVPLSVPLAPVRAVRPLLAGALVGGPGRTSTRRRSAIGRLPAAVAGLCVVGLLVVGSLPIVPNGPTLGEAATPSRSPADAAGVPDGGYAAGELLSFRLTPDARAVLDISVETECGGGVLAGPVQLDGRGGFRIVGREDGVMVDVAGAMASRSRAEGLVRVRRTGCDTGNRSFVARLS